MANIWIAAVSMGNRKSCPSCGVKLLGGNSIVSVGEYISGKYRKALYACRECLSQELTTRLHAGTYDIKVRSGCHVSWLSDFTLHIGVR